MRLLTPHGDEIPVKTFTFPDGQPHVDVAGFPSDSVLVETALRSTQDVFELLLLKDVLDHNEIEADLEIKYMLGARMDRRIDDFQPATLDVLAGLIRRAGFRSISVLDPHSSVTLRKLGAKAVFPFNAFDQVLDNRPSLDFTVLVIPDKGARGRVELLNRMHLPMIQGHKYRNPQTGKLSGFDVTGDVNEKSCLIVDDICDGGGTFTGLAAVLRAKGALKVDLFVTHGLFTKGLPLEGIDSVYTTSSVCPDPFPPARVYEP